MRVLAFVFEDFVLDRGRRELRRANSLVAAEPKVFDLLVHLIANRERVVSKDDLIAAVWDGRVVSDAALATAINAARVVLGDSGEAQRLIRTLPRKGFRFVGEVREQEAAGAPADATAAVPTANLALPDRPSLAVLPFASIGSSAEQDYFADGVVEEMITALSRMRSLFVIARNSSFTFKGRQVDVREVGRELGVRYVLEGSVRKAAGRLRITAQLVDATTGTNLWADRFEGALDDVFELQDQVTTSVVAAVSPQLERAEIARAKRKATGSLDAYDFYLRGLAGYNERTRESIGAALRDFYRAIELGPDLAAAYAMAAMAYAMRKSRGWVEDREREVAETRRLARQAVEIGRDDAVALGFSGYALAHAARELDDGAALIDCALQLNPNLGSVLLASGWVKIWLGEPEAALEHLALAMRLSPLDPHMYMMQAATAHAHFFAGRFGESAAWAQKARREQIEGLPLVRIAAASLALSGRAGEARAAVERLLRFDPALRLSNFHETLGPYRHQEHVTQYRDALRKAGLPD
jgi:TolB-like protein/tetratricopeptide (TPR) repeat protein